MKLQKSLLPLHVQVVCTLKGKKKRRGGDSWKAILRPLFELTCEKRLKRKILNSLYLLRKIFSILSLLIFLTHFPVKTKGFILMDNEIVWCFCKFRNKDDKLSYDIEFLEVSKWFWYLYRYYTEKSNKGSKLLFNMVFQNNNKNYLQKTN